MDATRVLVDAPDIDYRLAQFGVSRQELIDVARGVVAARSDATADDPASAEGLLAYIYGTRLVRQLFQKIGWARLNQNNVASVKHPDRALQVVYQSVDLAADKIHTPRAISGKGAGADRVISGQGWLFESEEPKLTAGPVTELLPGVWFFCVSVQGDEVRAELSLPSGIADGNFESFVERIFITEGDDSAAITTLSERPSGTDIEPTVVRRV